MVAPHLLRDRACHFHSYQHRRLVALLGSNRTKLREQSSLGCIIRTEDPDEPKRRVVLLNHEAGILASQQCLSLGLEMRLDHSELCVIKFFIKSI